MQVCACAPDQLDLLPLVAAYLEQVGVKIEIQPMEYAAFSQRHDDADDDARVIFMRQRSY